MSSAEKTGGRRHNHRSSPAHVKMNLGREIAVERNLHRVWTRLIQRKIDHRNDREIHLERRVWTRRDIQLAVG